MHVPIIKIGKLSKKKITTLIKKLSKIKKQVNSDDVMFIKKSAAASERQKKSAIKKIDKAGRN